jgi:2-polyprenyl-3-methyl-5-hydroxy-6-metoxy-1,4-benzoquinol methylase
MPERDKKTVSDMIRESWKQDNPTGWFDKLYAAAHDGEARVPWAYMQPNPELIAWLDAQQIDGSGQRALVVGCGLGDDAEGLAAYGFDVIAFDVSETAIQWAHERFPQSKVHYTIADLFALPQAWQASFDLVVEIRTVQALPHEYAERAMQAIAAQLKPGGTLLVMCLAREPEDPRGGIPWPLSRRELQAFIDAGLTETHFEDIYADGARRFRITYTK